MFEKLPEEHRKEFIRQTFVYMPIGLIFGIIGAYRKRQINRPCYSGMTRSSLLMNCGSKAL